MIGAGTTVTTVNLSDLVPWTRGEIDRIVESVFAPPGQSDSEHRMAFRTVFQCGLRPVIELTARFLGEAPDVSGGTMGEPRRPPKWMYLLMDALSDSFHAATLFVFEPPYSIQEKSKRAYCRYLWHMVDIIHR